MLQGQEKSGQASWGVMKEDRMDVELCYSLFSAELESAEALASSQQKFKTLNLDLVRVAPDCNRSYCEDSFSGYSGSV